MNAKWVHRAVLLAVLGTTFPAASFAGFDVGITVGFAPPALPVYVQPPCPASGYLWTPGYWAYSDEEGDYYWVPGTWVAAPSRGLLWTPGYWAELDDEYVWHAGYWAPHVGFYGGINYGFGYFGLGYAGGYWRDRDFFYNRSVTNVSNVNITNVYNNTVINNHFDGARASFNGGDGIHARPTRSELIAEREPHRSFTQPQRLQAESARTVPALLASVNHGHPSIGATARPGDFRGHSTVPTRAINNSSGQLHNVPASRTAAPAPHYGAAPQAATFAPHYAPAPRPAAPAPHYAPAPRPTTVASHYAPASRAAAVAPSRAFAPGNTVSPRPAAPVASSWHMEPHAPAPAARWSPPARPAAPNASPPHVAQGNRFNGAYAAPPRNESPRAMSVPMQRAAPPPRPPVPAPAHDHRRA